MIPEKEDHMSFMSALGKAVAQGVLLGVKYIVALVFLYGIGWGALQIYMQQNPEFARTYEQGKKQVSDLLENGLPTGLPGKVSQENLAETLTALQQNMKSGAKVKTIDTTSLTMLDMAKPTYSPEDIPPQLAPLEVYFSSLENPELRQQLLEKLKVKHVGQDGEQALAFIRKALNNNNDSLRKAAYASLQNLQGPQAQALLKSTPYPQ
jgi:hypothetical protein